MSSQHLPNIIHENDSRKFIFFRVSHAFIKNAKNSIFLTKS